MKMEKPALETAEVLFSFLMVVLLFFRALHYTLMKAPDPEGFGLLYIVISDITGAVAGIAIARIAMSRNASIDLARQVSTCITAIISIFSWHAITFNIVIACCACSLVMFIQSRGNINKASTVQCNGVTAGWRSSMFVVIASIIPVSSWIQASSGSTIVLYDVPWVIVVIAPVLSLTVISAYRGTRGASKMNDRVSQGPVARFDSSPLAQAVSAFSIPVMVSMIVSAFDEINHATVNPGTEWVSYLLLLVITSCLGVVSVVLRPEALPFPLNARIARWITFWAFIGLVALWWTPYLLSAAPALFRTSPTMNAMFHVSGIFIPVMVLVPTVKRVLHPGTPNTTKTLAIVAFSAGTCCGIVLHDEFLVSYRDLIAPSIVALLVCTCVLAWYKSNAGSITPGGRARTNDDQGHVGTSPSSALGTRFLTVAGTIVLSTMGIALANVRLNTLPFPSEAWFLFVCPVSFLIPACLVFSETARNAISKALARGPVVISIIILVALTWLLPYILASRNLHGTGASMPATVAVAIHVVPTVFIPCLVAVLVIFSTGYKFHDKNYAGIILTGFFGLTLGTVGWQISLYNYEDLFGPSIGFLVLLLSFTGTWHEARRRVRGTRNGGDKNGN